VPGSGPLTVSPNDSTAANSWAAGGGGPANPQDLNRYAYAANNPLKYTDPTGHCIFLAGADALLCIGGAILIGGALAAVATSPNSGFNASDYDWTNWETPWQWSITSDVGEVERLPGSYQSDASGTTSSDTDKKPSTLAPGPYAGDSIPARGPGRDFTPDEREQIDRIGQTTGCHTCGSTDPGTRDGHFVPDHQPPNALNPSGNPQRLYPHCINCSRRQGGEIRTQQRRTMRAE
jgi:hypothetical protein